MTNEDKDRSPLADELLHSEEVEIDDKWASFSQEEIKVFQILVPDSEQASLEWLQGMLAYSRYTLQKNEFIEYISKTRGTLPSDDEITAIVASFQNHNSDIIKKLKQQSEQDLTQIIQDYANQVAQEKFIKPIEEILTKNLSSLEKSISRKSSFWTSVQASVAASLFYSLLIAMILFIATAALPDTKFSRIIRILFETEEVRSE